MCIRDRGIGEEKHTLAQLGESYAEAKRAMEVGSIFHPGESIYMFRRLIDVYKRQWWSSPFWGCACT